MLGSKEKGFLLLYGGAEGGQGGVALGRSCTLPGFSLGGPPGGGQVAMVLREEGTRREVGGVQWEEKTLGSKKESGTGRGRGNSKHLQAYSTHHSRYMLYAFIEPLLCAGFWVFVQDFFLEYKAFSKHTASSQTVRW